MCLRYPCITCRRWVIVPCGTSDQHDVHDGNHDLDPENIPHDYPPSCINCSLRERETPMAGERQAQSHHLSVSEITMGMQVTNMGGRSGKIATAPHDPQLQQKVPLGYESAASEREAQSAFQAGAQARAFIPSYGSSSTPAYGLGMRTSSARVGQESGGTGCPQATDSISSYPASRADVRPIQAQRPPPKPQHQYEITLSFEKHQEFEEKKRQEAAEKDMKRLKAIDEKAKKKEAKEQADRDKDVERQAAQRARVEAQEIRKQVASIKQAQKKVTQKEKMTKELVDRKQNLKAQQAALQQQAQHRGFQMTCEEAWEFHTSLHGKPLDGLSPMNRKKDSTARAIIFESQLQADIDAIDGQIDRDTTDALDAQVEKDKKGQERLIAMAREEQLAEEQRRNDALAEEERSKRDRQSSSPPTWGGKKPRRGRKSG